MLANENKLKRDSIHTSVVNFNGTTCGTATTQLGLLSFQPPTSKGSPNATGVGNEGCGGVEGRVTSESPNIAAVERAVSYGSGICIFLKSSGWLSNQLAEER